MSIRFDGLGNIGSVVSSVSKSLDSLRYGVNVIRGLSFHNILNGVFPHTKSSGAKVKGVLMDCETGDFFKFQYNPETVEYSREANYAEIVSPGMQYPLTYFVNGGSKTFSLELFEYDRPSTGLIRKHIQWFEGFMPRMSNHTGNVFVNPHALAYSYGGDIFKCVLTGYKYHIDMFDESGQPYLCHHTLNLRVVDVPKTKKEIPQTKKPGGIGGINISLPKVRLPKVSLPKIRI